MKKYAVLVLFLFIAFLFISCIFDGITVNVSLSDFSTVEQPSDTGFKGYWPDGKLCVVKQGDKFNMFWGEADSFKTTANTPYVEDHINLLKNGNKVYGKNIGTVQNGQKIKDFNENGSWFIGVFPLDDTGKYVGFFHGESHWDNSGAPAHKSIGVVYSDDYGSTWHDPAPIIVDCPKPSTPDWTGLGDGVVIWDHINNRWVCYYQGRRQLGSNCLSMAVSYDKRGASGTWKKWDGNDFTIDAYASGNSGRNVAINNLKDKPGANPSVMWNTYLNKWIMVYATWEKRICISQSVDGVYWSKPKEILGSSEHPVWYPNLISEEGDTIGGKTVQMYYSLDQNPSNGIRKIGKCTLTFE